MKEFQFLSWKKISWKHKNCVQNYPKCHYVTVVLYSILSLYLIKKIFRQINSLVISLVKSLLSRIFCQKCIFLCRKFTYIHMYVCTYIIPPHFKNFREINLQNNSLVKKLVWRNFCKIFRHTVLLFFELLREIELHLKNHEINSWVINVIYYLLK